MKDQVERLISDMVNAGVFFQDAVSEFEKKYIRKVLEVSGGNQSRAAKALGIHRNTLGRKMEEYHLSSSRNGSAGSSKPARRSRSHRK
ncbi:MAG: helix-turn-helix domain-containing protein [Acidobacteria bacterium]|nr:helix-turn-helix domain-containing protein [Acidobacteriota bacterium]